MLDDLSEDLIIQALHTCLDAIEKDLAQGKTLDPKYGEAIDVFIHQCEAMEYDHVSSEFYAATDLYVRCLIIKTTYADAVDLLQEGV